MRHQGFVFRCHSPKWAYQPVSAAGAAAKGGRFNPKNVPALYTSLDPLTAVAEVMSGLALPPKTLATYYVDYENIADLTTDESRRDLHVDLLDLKCEWELLLANNKTPPSWDVATRLMRRGFSGAKVPSFANHAPSGGVNLVLWTISADPPTQILVHDPNNELPVNQKSWPRKK